MALYSFKESNSAIRATVIFAVFGLVSPSSGQPAQNKVDQFLRDFQDLDQRSQSEREAASESLILLWSPYLGRQFESGLTTDQLRKARRDAGRMNCEAVLTWEQKGFAALFPELQGIFEMEDILSYFRTVIVPKHSHPHQRCRALAEIYQFILGEQSKYTQISTATVRGYINAIVNPDLPVSPDNSVKNAAHQLVRLLACQDYVPIFGDLIRLYRRHGVRLINAANFALYLTLRARQLGLAVIDDNAVYTAAKEWQASPNAIEDARAIEFFMATGDLETARRATVDYDWFCKPNNEEWQPRG